MRSLNLPGGQINVMEKEDLTARLVEKYPGGMTLRMLNLTGDNLAAWLVSGSFDGEEYLTGVLTPDIPSEEGAYLTAEARLTPEQYPYVEAADSMYSYQIHDLMGRGDVSHAEVCTTELLQKNPSLTGAELFVRTDHAAQWLYLEGIQLKEAMTVAIHHPELTDEKLKTVLQLMDINRRGADAMTEGRCWTDAVKEAVRTRTEPDEPVADYDKLVRAQAELNLRQMGILSNEQVLLAVDFDAAHLQQSGFLAEMTERFNAEFRYMAASEPGHAVYDAAAGRMLVSLYSEMPMPQMLMRQCVASLPGVTAVHEEPFRDVKCMQAFYLKTVSGNIGSVYKGYINPPLDDERMKNFDVLPLHRSDDESVQWRIGGEADTPDSLWVERGSLDKVLAAGGGQAFVRMTTPVIDHLAEWGAENRRKRPLMQNTNRGGVYFYQKDGHGYMHLDRMRRLTEVGEPLAEEKRQTVLQLQKEKNIVLYRGQDIGVFFCAPPNAEKRVFIDSLTGNVRHLTVQRNFDGKEILTDGQRVVPTDTLKDITARITEATVYGKNDRWFVRCKIDGVQMGGTPLLQADVRRLMAQAGRTDSAHPEFSQGAEKALAARYFQHELEKEGVGRDRTAGARR